MLEADGLEVGVQVLLPHPDVRPGTVRAEHAARAIERLLDHLEQFDVARRQQRGVEQRGPHAESIDRVTGRLQVAKLWSLEPGLMTRGPRGYGPQATGCLSFPTFSVRVRRSPFAFAFAFGVRCSSSQPPACVRPEDICLRSPRQWIDTPCRP